MEFFSLISYKGKRPPGSCISFSLLLFTPVTFPSGLFWSAFWPTRTWWDCECLLMHTASLNQPPKHTLDGELIFLFLFLSGRNCECVWSRLLEGLTLLIFFSNITNFRIISAYCISWTENNLLRVIMGRRWSCYRHWPIPCLPVLFPLDREGATQVLLPELVWLLEPDNWHVHPWYLLSREKERLVLLGTLDAKTVISSLGQSSQRIWAKRQAWYTAAKPRLQPTRHRFHFLGSREKDEPSEKAGYCYHLTRKGWGKILLQFIPTDFFLAHWLCEWLYG